MYEIVFYRDQNGVEPVKEYLLLLAKQQSKDSRIKLNKIRDYIKILSEFGTYAGEPYIKHLLMIFGSSARYEIASYLSV